MRQQQQLVFLALASLAAGSALAQSSVRVYGTLDTSVVYGKGSNGRLTTVGAGNNIPSRLGFAGSEDLGGGLRANFTLEAGLNNDNGTGATTNTGNQAGAGAGSGGLTFNRQSWVGLQSATLGELRLGRNFTPSYRAYLAYDPFNGGGLGASQAAMGAIAAYGHPAGVRHSNAIEYWSPTALPVRVHLSHALGENASSAGATRDDGDYTGGRISYVQGGLDVGVAYARYRLVSVGDLRETNVGAKYGFGAWTLYGMFTRNTTGNAGDMEGWLLGAGHRSGPWELRTSLSTSERENAAGANVGKVRKFAIGPTYHLSKRTSLYVLYARNRNENGAASIPWAGTATNGPNGTSQALALGVTHSF